MWPWCLTRRRRSGKSGLFARPEWTDLNPRLSASYDLFGTGKTAVKVSLGRYVAAEAAGDGVSGAG